MKSESEIYNAARKLFGAAREQFLESECGSNPGLKRKVEALLDADGGLDATQSSIGHSEDVDATRQHESGDGDSFSLGATQDSGTASPTAAGADFSVGDSIGPYRLLQPLGQGGMGEVWIAEQSKPVKRRVALKVIKGGVGSREIIARFEAERQAVSMMNHPNIARILDAGATDDGQPYFVMELVNGKPLTAYCDENKVGIEERLRLFTDVCAGVQHAHQKGIIHRDLKPGNIIVGIQDGKAIPKVIDFGLAKAMESTQRLTDQSLFTGIGQILGTLKYMSPEQASLDAIDIDTRTDVYALGVILYELLTGSTPLDGSSIKQQAALKVLEFIREKEPVKPSSKLSSSTDEQKSAISQVRRTDSVRLNRILAGDLDWIVMKALEKDRKRRYESVSGFADDINRYLSNDPVIARPPSLNYRVSKFVQKNRAGVIAASVVALTMIAGIIGTTYGMVLASQRAEAEQLAREKSDEATAQAVKANLQALKRLDQLEKSNEILTDVFEDIDNVETGSSSEPLSARLAKKLMAASRQLHLEVIGDSRVVSRMNTKIGASLLNLGFKNEAQEILERELKTLSLVAGRNDNDTLSAMTNLAGCYAEKNEFDKAADLWTEVFEIRRKQHGLENIETLHSMNNAAGGYWLTGNAEEAKKLWEKALAGRERMLGKDHKDTQLIVAQLATVYYFQGDYQKAIAFLSRAVSGMEVSAGVGHPQTLAIRANLISIHSQLGNHKQMIELSEKQVRLATKYLGSMHPTTLDSQSKLVDSYTRLGEYGKAIKVAKDTLGFMKAKLGARDVNTIECQNGLALALSGNKQYEKAIPIFLDAIEKFTSVVGASNTRTLRATWALGEAYEGTGALAKANSAFEVVVKLGKESRGISHADTLTDMNNLSIKYFRQKDFEKALELRKVLYVAEQKKYGRSHPTCINGVNIYSKILVASEQHKKSKKLLTEELDYLVRELGPDRVELAPLFTSLGATNMRQKDFAAARDSFDSAYQIWLKQRGENWETFNAQILLGTAMLADNSLELAEPMLVNGFAGLQRLRNKVPMNGKEQRFTEAISRLIELYTALGRPKEIEKWKLELRTVISESKASGDSTKIHGANAEEEQAK